MSRLVEEWRPVVGYEGLYEVSNLGRIKSLKRVCFTGKYYREINEKIMINHFGTNGYLSIVLSKNGKKSPKMIHRLVAEHFLENPYNLPEVNHIDENKSNNCVWNLEWCTREYNANYGTKSKRVGEKQSKKVYLYNENDILVATFNSTVEAAKKLNMTQAAVSYDCLKNCRLRKPSIKNYRLSYN